MTIYADATRCPDCRAVLPQTPEVCPVCSLPLTGDTAGALFRTFQEADRLLGSLRDQKRPVALPSVATLPAGGRLDSIEPYPAPRRPAAPIEAPRVTGSSVPRILLSLGALCLLVAAVTFLAVAWGWLGVGGRTLVLVALTGASSGLSVALVRRGLRLAGEALSVVALGLVAIDFVGVRHAGWLGTIDDAQLTFATGVAVATGALLMLVATADRPLVAPAVVAPFATLAAGLGAQADVDHLVPTVVTVAVLLGWGRVGTLLPSRPLQVTSLVVGGLGWAGLLVAAVAQLEGLPITVAGYVGHLDGWPLLAATVLAVAVGPVTGMRRGVDVGGYAVAGLIGTYTVLMPVLDNERTAMVAAVLTASALWVGLLLVAPARLRPATLLPLGGTLVVPSVASAYLLSVAATAMFSVGEPFSQPFDVRIAAGATEVSPLLLLPSALTIAAAGCAIARLVIQVRRAAWLLALGCAAVLGVFATLPLYDVPLAVVAGILVLAGVGGFVAAESMHGSAADQVRLAVLVLTTGATLVALPSDLMVSLVLLVACVMSAYLMVRTDSTGEAACLCFPIAFAALVWAGGNVMGVDEQVRAIPVLLVVGGLAIWRPQVELEASAAFAAALVSAASVLTADDVSVALAVYLTVAGVLVTASSIVNPSRRALAWPGGVLLAAATWVRLYDLDVHVPEAYTLPSALALVVVGAWRLRKDDRSATLTVLTPGLALATVPSLLATLDDPYSLRALLLGLACLVLTLVGAALRWSAPLVVGAAVGGVLVLRELAPYAAQVPTWLTIGVSGALLLGAGITWESRMNDVRRASRYVAALR
ncbi:MAG TPA: hypothetical protein VH228_02140 [Nocardioides sp.]|jgi:hypothetical protein|nr:hypothetical protein [Nocardioides sp.]